MPKVFLKFTKLNNYTEAVLKFTKLNTQSQQRGAVVQGRSLSPYRLRYSNAGRLFMGEMYRPYRLW
ncbi:MAG: hypothetical protein LBK06_01875 [Planctomycetaceae bacterium]|nr:hypothetical protein [Planctomycetaceae bacterium]